MKNDGPMALAHDAAAASENLLSVRVNQVRFEARAIQSYELVDPDGGQLPPFEAGAHIDVHLPNGLVRQYSICSDPAHQHHYIIGVLRDESGRGGSRSIHESLHVQDIVRISAPRNNFRLRGGARKVLLLAGGIGVTPLKSMAHELERAGVDYELHYCAKDASCTAFRDEFASMAGSGRVRYHFDAGVPGQGLDIGALLGTPLPDTHVYYCGPAGFMKACAASTLSWPAGAVHCEHFKAPAAADPNRQGAAPQPPAGTFVIRLRSTGARVDVGPEQSMVDALQCAGVHVATSCSSGLCGTCKVRYLSGTIDHRDFILGAQEQAEFLTACVSRATSAEVELDL